MPKYKAFTPDVELIGSVLEGYKRAINLEAFSAYFAKHGLIDIDPDQWYPLQKLLDVFSDISEDPAFMMNFVSIGMAVATHTPLPFDHTHMPIEVALQKFTEVTQWVNRGTDVGDIYIEILGPRHVKVIYRLAGPDEYLYGVTYGYMRRLLPKGTPFKVYFDPDTARREQGGTHTIIHATWDTDYPQMKVPSTA